VLDPEQNSAFNDHYLDMDYDLSKVMFLCTANSLHGHPAAAARPPRGHRALGLHRAGEAAIARRYLLPKQLGAGRPHRASRSTSQTTRSSAMVRRYTKESGVRGLERQLARVCRKTRAKGGRRHGDGRVVVEEGDLDGLLGPARHDFGRREDEDQVGR
jgi:ATP-dependent Lon protease